uniref:Putative transposase n=1 Tax=Desmodus rotundus TaxID=9430 RepID=K9IHL7_DESRO
MDQMKEQIKTPQKELSDKEIANLSDAEFKTLVIGMLREMIEYSRKMKEEMKALQSEIKNNIQGTNNEEKKTGIQINNLEQKGEINIQPKQKEETRIQKSEERLSNLWDNFKHSNIQIIGMPEGEEEEQEIKNLFEKIMKENYPSLEKEIDILEVQEAQRVPKKLDPKRNTPRHIISKLSKIKVKENILKAAREKGRVIYKGAPIKLSADFSKETLQAGRGCKEVFKVMKSKDLHPRLLQPAKLSFRMEGQIKCFPDKVKLKDKVLPRQGQIKGVHHHQALIT